MNPSPDADDGEARFAAYAATPGGALGHADRVAPFRSHCTGPLLPGDRKSVEPMAARMEPGRVGAAHRSLRHFVAGAAWPDEAVPAAVQARALPVIEQKGPIRAWIADDAGVPRKGAHPVGVARQYRGQPGRRDDRRVAVTLPVANDHAGPPLAHRLYPPKPWAGDPARRTGAGVPEDAGFRTKPGIAPDRVRAAPGAGVPPAIVPADAGHGVDTDFRDGLTGPGPLYVVGIQSSTTLRPPGMAPLPPKPWSGRGRKPVLLRRDGGHQPVSAEDPAFGLSRRAWRRVAWREGGNGRPASRFAAVRVRPAHRDCQRPTPRPEEWRLTEWPEGGAEPTKHWLSTPSARVARRAPIDAAKLRWRIGRDYRDPKRELGLGRYEGRGWRGFHRHATLCVAACGFPILERAAFFPSDGVRPPSFPAPAPPEGHRPRGAAAPPRAPCRDVHHHPPHRDRPYPRQNHPALPMPARAECDTYLMAQ